MGRLTFTDKFVDITTIGEKHSDHPVQATLTFNTEQEAVSYVLGFGESMRIVHPQYLIEKVVQQAQTIITMYK